MLCNAKNAMNGKKQYPNLAIWTYMNSYTRNEKKKKLAEGYFKIQADALTSETAVDPVRQWTHIPWSCEMSCVFGLYLCAQNTWRFLETCFQFESKWQMAPLNCCGRLRTSYVTSDWIIRRTCHIWKTGRLSTSGQDSDASKCLAWPPGIPGNSTWRTECELSFWCGEDLRLFAIHYKRYVHATFIVCLFSRDFTWEFEMIGGNVRFEYNRFCTECAVVRTSENSFGTVASTFACLVSYPFPPLLFYIRFETFVVFFFVFRAFRAYKLWATSMNSEDKYCIRWWTHS